METTSLSKKIKEIIKESLKWYWYPLIYFFVTSILCAYAWYTRPFAHRDGIKVVFKTISVIPSVIWAGSVTLWIVVVILFVLLSRLLKKRLPETSLWSTLERLSKRKRESLEEKSVSKSIWKKIANCCFYFLGIIFIFGGITIAIWISRPYIALLLSTSRIEALENKVKLGQVYDNRIIIPSAIVDVPIIEGVDNSKLSRGVCRIPQSSLPGEGGNCIIEGHNVAEFRWWRPQSFFSMLEVLNKGDAIYIFYNGKKYIYKVKEKIYKNVNDSKLYDNTRGERLTLITCVSTWSPTIYTNRRTIIVAYPM
ncbi:MAG: sortase [Nitrospirota bacterium]